MEVREANTRNDNDVRNSLRKVNGIRFAAWVKFARTNTPKSATSRRLQRLPPLGYVNGASSSELSALF